MQQVSFSTAYGPKLETKSKKIYDFVLNNQIEKLLLKILPHFTWLAFHEYKLLRNLFWKVKKIIFGIFVFTLYWRTSFNEQNNIFLLLSFINLHFSRGHNFWHKIWTKFATYRMIKMQTHHSLLLTTLGLNFINEKVVFIISFLEKNDFLVGRQKIDVWVLMGLYYISIIFLF